MRLLVVGHSYVAAFNQKKYEVMKRQNPALELKIVSPSVVRDAYRTYAHEICPGLTAEEAVSLKSFFNGSNMTYVHPPIALLKLIRNFKPDLIHIEEDPHSLIALETIFLASVCCPKTPISFFIWDNINHTPRFPFNLIKRWFTSLTLRRAACVVAGNQEAQRLLAAEKHYHGRSAVLPQFGIDFSIYQREAKPDIVRAVGKQAGIPVIGFLGRLIPEKGILLLCEALAGLLHLDWTLVVMGAGPLESELQQKWKPTFGARLKLLGPGVRADLPDYLQCLDLLVSPSMSTPRWKEQFGYILVEAMASGVAVLGSSAGAIPEVIGDAGIVFPEGDVASLKEALTRLLQSPEERSRLSRLGRERAQRVFSHDVISASYMTLFQSIL